MELYELLLELRTPIVLGGGAVAMLATLLVPFLPDRRKKASAAKVK